jgi:hypothetical protein
VEWQYQEADWGKDFTSVRIHIWTGDAAPDQNIACRSSAELLDEMGSRHWELVSVIAGPGGEVFFFKRPRQSGEGYGFEPHYKSETK